MTLAAAGTEAGARRRARIDVDVWASRAAWVVVAFACAQILLFGYGRDQGIYAAVADAVLAGKMPYRDAWDFKPPGIFLVYALAQAAFGKAMVSVRILEVVGLVGTVLAFGRLGRELFGNRTVGLLGGALAALIHAELEFWHSGQPESFGGMLTMAALVLAVGLGVRADAPQRVRLLAWSGVGALLGTAFLLKPPLGGGAIVCALYFVGAEWRRGRRAAAVLPIGVVGVASLAPILLCGLWFWSRGAWPALHWTLFEFTPGYTRLGWTGTPHGLLLYAVTETLKGFSYVLPAGVAAGLVLPRLHDREREGILLVLAVFLMHAVGIALQAKFFQYHFAATLPVVSLVAGLGLYKALRLALRVPVAGIIIYVAILGWLTAIRVALRHNPGTFWERTADRMTFLVRRTPSREELDAKLYYVADYVLDADRRAGRAVARLTEPGETVFVWGFEPAVYWFSGREPASRYLYDVPQRAMWERERARVELLQDLGRSKPRVVVVQHNDVFHFVTGDDLDSAAALGTFPEMERLIHSRYRLAESVEDFDLYLRRD